MTADLINLRRAKKTIARERKAVDAAIRRVSFGLSKAERQKASAENELHATRLEAHRLNKLEDFEQ